MLNNRNKWILENVLGKEIKNIKDYSFEKTDDGIAIYNKGKLEKYVLL